MLAVNHLAPFLLTNLLLDRLKESGHEALYEVKQLSAGFTPKATDQLVPVFIKGQQAGEFCAGDHHYRPHAAGLGMGDEYWQREVDTLLKLLK